MQTFTPELERAALHQIAESWRSTNWCHFQRLMTSPSFGLFDSTTEYGRWKRTHRTIEIGRSVVFGHPWGVVEEVLKHEMVHQYVDEILMAWDETAHGAAFRAVCQKIGLDPSATGPLPETRIDDESANAQAKIARLLSLATSPNLHEAEAAMVAARRLMLKHNVRLAPQRKEYTFKQLGRPMKRVSEGMRVIARILGEHFFVEVLWVRGYEAQTKEHGRMLEIVGTPSNLAIAEYVYAYLLHAQAELWEQHRDRQRETGLGNSGKGRASVNDPPSSQAPRAQTPTRPQRRRGNRTSFEAGAMYGFLEKLKEEKRSPESRALVWVKDADLLAYFAKRHPRVTTIRTSGHRRSETFEAGRRAGREIILKKGVEGERSNHGRQLTAGRGSD